MITFSDSRLYAKGICEVMCQDIDSGNIVYFSDKFRTGNINTSVSMGEIRAGVGNAIAAIIPSDSGLTVEFNAADFNLFAKAAQVGAKVTYSAPEMVCADTVNGGVSVSGGALVVGNDNGTPVAELGHTVAYAYVQTIGSASPIAQDGVAYTIGADGTVEGFAAEAGVDYKVWYFVTRENAQVATIGANFDPKILHFKARIPIYSSSAEDGVNEGTRVGNLYAIVPYLQLGGNGGLNGDQSANDSTSISGQAVSYDEAESAGTCEFCGNAEQALAYYVYVPCDSTEGIQGLVLVGGIISAETNSSLILNGFRLVLADGSLVKPDAAKMLYTLPSAPEGVSITGNVLTTGSVEGRGIVRAQYGGGTSNFVSDALLVVEEAVVPIEPAYAAAYTATDMLFGGVTASASGSASEESV